MARFTISAELVRRALAGELCARNALAGELRELVRQRVGLRLQPTARQAADVDDLVQDASLQVHKALYAKHFENKNSDLGHAVVGLAIRIADCMTMHHIRGFGGVAGSLKHLAQSPDEVLIGLVYPRSLSSAEQRTEDWKRVLNALERLRLTYREIIVAVHIEHRTFAQICDAGLISSRNPDRVARLYRRAMQALRRAVKDTAG